MPHVRTSVRGTIMVCFLCFSTTAQPHLCQKVTAPISSADRVPMAESDHRASPGFPVGLAGSKELHAAFLKESRTRGPGWCCVTGNPGRPPFSSHVCWGERGAPSASLSPNYGTDCFRMRGSASLRPRRLDTGYFRVRAKITTRIRMTRRKAVSTSRIGSISCSLVRGAGTAGAANAGGANLGATTLGGSIAGA